MFQTRSAGSSRAAEGIGEDGWRGGAYSLELGEYLHGNQGPNIVFILRESLLCLQRSVSLKAPVRSPSQFPCLGAYVTYCCNQVGAKALLDQKKQEKRVEHFLRLCQESSFSRKLDLWNFLDLPRSRLVKYPLLLKEIQKCTPPEHPDEDTIPEAVSCYSVYINTLYARTFKNSTARFQALNLYFGASIRSLSL